MKRKWIIAINNLISSEYMPHTPGAHLRRKYREAQEDGAIWKNHRLSKDLEALLSVERSDNDKLMRHYTQLLLVEFRKGTPADQLPRMQGIWQTPVGAEFTPTPDSSPEAPELHSRRTRHSPLRGKGSGVSKRKTSKRKHKRGGKTKRTSRWF